MITPGCLWFLLQYTEDIANITKEKVYTIFYLAPFESSLRAISLSLMRILAVYATWFKLSENITNNAIKQRKPSVRAVFLLLCGVCGFLSFFHSFFFLAIYRT